MDKLNTHSAKHFRSVFFGGNWTDSNLKEQLADVSWEEATTRVYSLNTIAALTYHIGYFVSVAKKVLEGGALEGNDEVSFDHPPIESQIQWEKLVADILNDAEEFSGLVKNMPEGRMWEMFRDRKYGNYFGNIHGIIEHTHYHLGQIVVIKKIIRANRSLTP